jgi:hypothetical protein
MTMPMRETPIVDIDTALSTTLKADTVAGGVATLVKGASRIYAGAAPQNTTPPFIILGNSTEVDQSVFNKPGANSTVTIDIYTPGGRDKESCLAVYRAMMRKLHYQKLPMPSGLHTMIVGTLDLIFCIPDQDGTAMHAACIYRVQSLELPRIGA